MTEAAAIFASLVTTVKILERGTGIPRALA